MKNTKAVDVIEKLKPIFGVHGLPIEIMTDNGPPFDSDTFREFLKNEEIKHTTSSPIYPKSNGFIERQVQTFKNLIIKSPNEDIYTLMRIYNATPKDKLPSPAEILMGRKIKSNLILTENAHIKKNIRVQLEKKQEGQKRYYDRTAKTGEEIENEVLVQKSTKNWIPGKIFIKDVNPNSYWIKTEEGGVYRRNKTHVKNLRSRNDQQNTEDEKKQTTIKEIPTRENNPREGNGLEKECKNKNETEAEVRRCSKRTIFKPVKFQDYECY